MSVLKYVELIPLFYSCNLGRRKVVNYQTDLHISIRHNLANATITMRWLHGALKWHKQNKCNISYQSHLWFQIIDHEWQQKFQKSIYD
jgi:hypothetical protein